MGIQIYSFSSLSTAADGSRWSKHLEQGSCSTDGGLKVHGHALEKPGTALEELGTALIGTGTGHQNWEPGREP